MTTEMASPADGPRRLLSNANELALRVRRDQRATWFPLLVFAALTFIAIPALRYGGHHLDCQAAGSLRECKVFSDTQFVYWPVALMLAYTAIAAFYIRRSLARGIETRVRPYAIAGIIVVAAMTALALSEFRNPPVGQNLLGLNLNGLPDRLTSPGAAIGLALLVLARAERNRPLLLVTLAYLAAVFVPITFDGVQYQVEHNPPWYALPLAFQGCVLLVGGIGFALAQRPLRSPAA
jgi:hypothetical protein